MTLVEPKISKQRVKSGPQGYHQFVDFFSYTLEDEEEKNEGRYILDRISNAYYGKYPNALLWLFRNKEESSIEIPIRYEATYPFDSVSIVELDTAFGHILKKFCLRVINLIKKDDFTITLNDRIIAVIPQKLRGIYEAIEESKYIIDSKEIFDEDEIVKINPTTWIRAVTFVSDYAKWLYNKFSLVIELPKIYDGNNRSIDILWKNENYRLLINIPADENKPASYYGDDYHLDSTKGTFDPSRINQGLVLFFLKRL